MKNLKLYLIEQNINNDYDTYDSAVVIEASEEDARYTPVGELYTWAEPDYVKVTYIGIACASSAAGIVLASFNAG